MPHESFHFIKELLNEKCLPGGAGDRFVPSQGVSALRACDTDRRPSRGRLLSPRRWQLMGMLAAETASMVLVTRRPTAVNNELLSFQFVITKTSGEVLMGTHRKLAP